MGMENMLLIKFGQKMGVKNLTSAQRSAVQMSASFYISIEIRDQLYMGQHT